LLPDDKDDKKPPKITQQSVDKPEAKKYNECNKFILTSSALQLVRTEGRIVNRVRIPDGTAAVCAETEARWRKPVIGKLRRQSSVARRYIFCKRKSEDLLDDHHFCLRVTGTSFFVA
jgi:hypothetical protein